MLILPANTKDFSSMASGIVLDYVQSGTPLEDGIVKMSEERQLCPEEVRRLLEKTNMAMSLHLLKTADDKKGSVPLAEYAKVISRTHGDDELAKTASEHSYQGLTNTRDKQISLAAHMCSGRQVKTASSNKAASKAAVSRIFSAQRNLENARHKKIAMEMCVQDRIDYLASEYSTWRGPDFNKFASESLTLYGDVARPVLQGLAAYLRVPESFEKQASVVDDRTPHMKAMGEICQGLRELVKNASEISRYSSELNRIRAEVLEAAC